MTAPNLQASDPLDSAGRSPLQPPATHQSAGGGKASSDSGDGGMRCACCGSEDHYWAVLRKTLPEARYWLRWNLAFTKRLLRSAPSSQMAQAVLAAWPARIRRALASRFPAAMVVGHE